MLFTGDLGAEAEARLVRDGVDLRADVLKVPHHGSADADPGFLAASGAARRPDLGRGGQHLRPSRPRGRCAWLAADGMRIHRTDREGDLAVVGLGRALGRRGPRPDVGRAGDPSARPADGDPAAAERPRRVRSVGPA